MKSQKAIFIITAVIIVIGSFYFLFAHDFKNVPTTLKIVVDKKDENNDPFFEELRKEFVQKNNNVIINYVYLEDYNSSDYILKNDVDAWFASSESNIERLKSSYEFKNKANISLQPFTYATSPMVIIGWRDKLNKLGDIDIPKLYDIVTNNKYWSSYGGDVNWNKIKFTHADPVVYDTGTRLMALLTYNYNSQKGNSKDFITKYDLINAKEYILNFENKIKYQNSDSDYAIDEWVNYEPDSEDMMLFDEYTILKNIENVHTKWSNLKIVYPTPNINTDIPFVIVNSSKHSAEKVDLINKFKDFLLSEDIQQKVLKSGFRPVNNNVKELDTLEKEYYDFGFRKDITTSTIKFDSDAFSSLYDMLDKTN